MLLLMPVLQKADGSVAHGLHILLIKGVQVYPPQLAAALFVQFLYYPHGHVDIALQVLGGEISIHVFADAHNPDGSPLVLDPQLDIHAHTVGGSKEILG